MESFFERAKASLSPAQSRYLRELVSRWGFLADLCFSDLVIYLPVPKSNASSGLVVAGQARPATAQTVHPSDLIGMYYQESTVPMIVACLRSGGFTFSEWIDPQSKNIVVSHCIPLREEGAVFGVLVRDHQQNPQRIQGELEITYTSLFDRFAKMISAGEFPYLQDEVAEIPRVGDGVIVLDQEERITFMSPNALSALHRLGSNNASRGSTLSQSGIDILGPSRAREGMRPVFEEIESPPDVTVAFYSLPLLQGGGVTGLLLLLRDVSDLRSKERQLVFKDATIREVHHRVKNNLQTISSLLRLQARRIASDEGKAALIEAERRIRSIAVVHEILSREVGDEVSMAEIVDAIVRLANESAPLGAATNIAVQGSLGEIEAQVAMPLALVLAELLQNSIEHAKARLGELGSDDKLEVTLTFLRKAGFFQIEVRDNGLGFPEGFSLGTTTSLGLSIVRDLIRTQLHGEIELKNEGGAVVRLSIPCYPRK